MKPLSYGSCISGGDIAEVVSVLQKDWFAQELVVERFEKALAEYIGVRDVVVFSSGTAALHGTVAVIGMKPGHMLLTTPLTSASTANVSLYAGAEPAFVDISRGTLCMDPVKTEKKLEESRGRVRAVVPVSFAGYPFDISAFKVMAREHGAVLIEDARHSIGGHRIDYQDFTPHKFGRDADMTVFSFGAASDVSTAEGGAAATDEPELARRLRLFRSHGVTANPAEWKETPDSPWYSEMQMLGFNYRLTHMQCALGLSQLKRLDESIEKRREIATLYRLLIAGIDGVYQPPAQEGHAYNLFPICVEPEVRNPLFDCLTENGIRLQAHFQPVPLQYYYRKRFGFKKGEFPEAESFCERSVFLPMHPSMEDSDVERVVGCVKKFFKSFDKRSRRP